MLKCEKTSKLYSTNKLDHQCVVSLLRHQAIFKKKEKNSMADLPETAVPKLSYYVSDYINHKKTSSQNQLYLHK